MNKSKFTKRQINSFATKLAKLNTELWDVINDCEEMLNEDIAKEIREESDLELLKQVACIFADKCQDEAPADTELYGATLSTACALIGAVIDVAS